MLPDYEKMYYTLFNSITDVIEILKKAQSEAEQYYLSAQSDIINFSEKSKDNS